MVVSKSKRKRKMEKAKKAQEKAAKKAKTNQKLIIGPLLVLAIVGWIYLSEDSNEVETSDTITITSEQAKAIGLYKTLNRSSAHEPGKVKIQEFMSFYCDHCYDFNGLMHELESKYAGKVEVELVPIYWGEGSIKPGEAYIIAENLGFGTEMADAIFRATFVGRKNIGSEDVLIGLAKEMGLGDEFAAKLRSGEAEDRAEENLRLSSVYEVEETPTLIVDGNLRVTPHETGDDVVSMAENLDLIIEGLLEQ